MHGLSESDELAYWLERAQAAEKQLAELRESLRNKTWLTQSDARFVLQLLDRLTQHDLANTPSQEAYDAVATALANAQAREAALMPVVEAAQAWGRAGSNPCGECEQPHLCTECTLFNAVDALRGAKP